MEFIPGLLVGLILGGILAFLLPAVVGGERDDYRKN